MTLLPLLAALLLAPAALADAYKCQRPDGRIEISNKRCPSGSGTLAVRPDEPVPEANRQQAEQDIARMRRYVERREAALRADKSAEQAPATPAKPGVSTAREALDAESCLRQLDQQTLDADQRARGEAECRKLAHPGAAAQPPASDPPDSENALIRCLAAVQSLRIPSAEQQRMRLQCEAGHGLGIAPAPLPQLESALPLPSIQIAPTPPRCPPNAPLCGR